MTAIIHTVDAAMLIDEETSLLTKSAQDTISDDLEDSPLGWQPSYKWAVVVLVTLMTTLEYVHLYKQPTKF